MACGNGPCAAAAHFNPKKAERDLRRYQRHGPDVTTRFILEELRRWPLQGLRLLDVGGGIGVIAVELAGTNLASVTFADASAGYLEAARRHLASGNAPLPTQFFLGDFAAARQIVAFTYPRDQWYVRAAVVLENSWYWLRRDSFRAFVHPPGRMARVLESAGFVRAARHATLQWAFDLYRRGD